MHRQQTSGCGVSLYTPGVIPEELRDQFGNACELVCVQVPKVYDSCLLRLCLVGDCRQERPSEGIFFDPQLIAPVENCSILRVQNARVVRLVPGTFNIIEKRPVPGDPDRKFITYSYTLEIAYDRVFPNNQVFPFTLDVTRTETVGPLYCPDNVAIIREVRVDQTGTVGDIIDADDEIIKLEIIARVLDARIIREELCDPCNPCNVVDSTDQTCCIVFTLGIYNIIKCELEVQLVIPAFGFCPPPAPCEVLPDRSPCEEFNEELPPAFFPPQLNTPITGPGIED